MKPLILQYLKNFKLFLCLADLPNLNDLMWAFFQKIEYKNLKNSHCLYQAEKPGNMIYFIVEG